MRHCTLLVLVGIALVAGCARSVNVTQERESLLAKDREWSQTTKDTDKFLSYYAADASMYAPGMPVVNGTAGIRDAYTQMASAPGFALQWTANKADVSTSGDLGYTSGTYQMSMNGMNDKGKFVTVWKKENGDWKVSQDIINSDEPAAAPTAAHVMVPAANVTFGPAPPVLPAGAKMAVVSGDPSKAGPYVVRLQMPAGYTIAPHWHPTDESVTVLSGTLGLGMGDTLDKTAAQDLGTGGFANMPAQMHHYAIAKGATTVQIHGMGPFAITYVNAADDPSKAPK
jgi:ketosteroid isomerase-like protein